MKQWAFLFMIAAALTVSACNTIEGVGKDVSSAGEGISSGSKATKEKIHETKDTL